LGRVGETGSFLRGFVRPGAGDNVVHLGRVGGGGRGVLLVVGGEEVEDDRSELSGPTALGEKDMVRLGDVKQRSDASCQVRERVCQYRSCKGRER
jgi:hypothetical protein